MNRKHRGITQRALFTHIALGETLLRKRYNGGPAKENGYNVKIIIHNGVIGGRVVWVSERVAGVRPLRKEPVLLNVKKHIACRAGLRAAVARHIKKKYKHTYDTD